VRQVELDGADRGATAQLLRDSVADGAAVTGVLFLLAFDEQPYAEGESVPAVLVLTATLVQALGDAGIAAPLWCVTRGAVSTGRS
ncbi:hypothetical protein, partial [Saccharothrix sp. ST-888]|uniref:hypothetical protein n=1 Tax=Saccharothrix sp. ST-888 TaxID=1427391 RepID=UPI0005ED1BD2